MTTYRIVEHTADTGFELDAATLPGLFAGAAEALFDMMWQAGPAADDREIALAVEAGDLGELMVNFLEEFLYHYDTAGLVFHRVAIDSVSATGLAARATGHPFREGRDRERLGVKAITYHQLEVAQSPKGAWHARVILDI